MESKSALLIGCATGIGAAIALDLSSKGWHLTLADISQQKLEEVAYQCSKNQQGKQFTK